MIFAQSVVQFTYDATGNRIKREFIPDIPNLTGQTSEARNSQLGETQLQEVITVYPNPTKDYIQIEVGEELPNATIELFDIFGRQLSKESLNGYRHAINVSHRPSGQYILIIRNKDFREEWKIVKIE